MYLQCMYNIWFQTEPQHEKLCLDQILHIWVTLIKIASMTERGRFTMHKGIALNALISTWQCSFSKSSWKNGTFVVYLMTVFYNSYKLYILSFWIGPRSWLHFMASNLIYLGLLWEIMIHRLWKLSSWSFGHYVEGLQGYLGWNPSQNVSDSKQFNIQCSQENKVNDMVDTETVTQLARHMFMEIIQTLWPCWLSHACKHNFI